MATKITKKLVREYIQHKLVTSEAWRLHALKRIYSYQTENEQLLRTTNENNGVGFSGADGVILSSLAEYYKRYGRLTVKQLAILNKKIKKYWKQILSISDRGKLLRCMITDGWLEETDVFIEEL